MNRFKVFRANAGPLLTLGLPLIGSHLAQFAIALTDTAMLGWYDVRDLAGQVLGSTVFFILFMVGSGFAWAVMPMVAAADAGDDVRQIRRVTRMGLWASLMFACLAVPLLLLSGPLLVWLGQDPELADIAAGYLSIAGNAMWPALVVMVFKSYLAALEETKIVMWITIVTAIANGVLNYMLIFGHWGAPELGVQGAALASLLANLAAALMMVLYVMQKHPEHDLLRRFWRVDRDALRQVVRLGFPIGMTTLCEVGLFAASTLMMGWLGEIPLAAHGIALQVTSAVFMIHVGLSNAATIRAGQAFGRQDVVQVRAVGGTALALALSVAVVTAIVFLTVPDFLIGLFMSPDEPDRQAVLSVGRVLLAAAALFQLVDASQIVALSLLRGVQDTKVPMILAAISYWLVGVPVSYVLGFGLGLGGVGVWLGLAVGLALAAGLLMGRFWTSTLLRIA